MFDLDFLEDLKMSLSGVQWVLEVVPGKLGVEPTDLRISRLGNLVNTFLFYPIYFENFY